MPWTTAKTWAVNELLTAVALNTHLRDNLNALKDPPTALALVGSTYASTSTSFVNIDSTGLAVTITTSGGDVLIGFSGAWVMGAAGNIGYLTVAMDGVNIGGASGIALVSSSSAVPLGVAFLKTSVPPGAHTFRLQWRVTGSTVTLYALGEFWAREVS